MTKKIKPIHPGEILMEEFLKPFGISQYRLAKDIGVAPLRINEIVRELRIITTDTALRLGKYFSVSPQFWLNLQSHYNLEIQTEILSDILEYDVKILKEDCFLNKLAMKRDKKGKEIPFEKVKWN